MKIAELSRFRSSKEAETVKKLESGEIDIVIGTHKLLSREVKLKRLGLVIIDEEHRFGVRQKEALKKRRGRRADAHRHADPRTLAMSLEGIRDFSVIATAPEKRLAIKTFVAPWSEGLIREAVMRELRRGGQVYFLHNEVDSIERMRSGSRAAAGSAHRGGPRPDARARPGARDARLHRAALQRAALLDHHRDRHRQPARQHHRHQPRRQVRPGAAAPAARPVGLAPPGLRLPADPPEEALSKNAAKRLEAIQMMEELGSGFYLAMHDLEIRGAGEILGESQSGEIQEVGFSLYARMLERAVRKLKAGKAPEMDDFEVATEVNLHVPALLPAATAATCTSACRSTSAWPTPRRASSSTCCARSWSTASASCPSGARAARVAPGAHRRAPLGVARIDATHESVQLQFVKNPPLDGAKVIDFIRRARRAPRRPGQAARRRQAAGVAGARAGGAGHPQAARGMNLAARARSRERRPGSAALLGRPHAVGRSRRAPGFNGAMKNEGIAPPVRGAAHRPRLDRRGRRFADLRLLAMDMDSTLITIECIDELGDCAGKKAEIAAITAQAMRGEIEYRESLRRRVKALAGWRKSALPGLRRALEAHPGRGSADLSLQEARRAAPAGLRRLQFLHRAPEGAPRPGSHGLERARR